MAKFNVLQKWHDLEQNITHQEGDEIDITVKRAEEVIKNLPQGRGEFLKRVHPPKRADKNGQSTD